MSLNVCAYSFDIYGNGLKMLAERLRNNWMQKLSNQDEPDDSLTSLAWLYDMHPIGLDLETPSRGNELPVNNLTDYPKYMTNECQPFAGSLLDPQVRMDYRTKWTGKPPFSYATLICLAMRELGKPKVTLSDIYGWIMSNFAYYRHTDSSWQNSVRHNLSLNKCFEKVPRDKGERGKGGFWRVNPRHADWLEANLAKCRRAAPPPGPPPPIPRSMLLQQQQQHGMLHSNNLLTPGQMTVQNSITFTQCPNPSSTAYISEIAWESSKLNRVPALSPSSASSHSSLSSSPLSFPSVGSPVALPNKIPQVTNAHTVSPSISAIFRNQPVLSDTCDTNISHFSLPAVHLSSSHVSQNHSNQILATHRRKSPLFHHPDSDTPCSNLESDEELNFDHENKLRKPEKHSPMLGLKKVPNHLPRLSNRSTRLNELPKNSRPNLTTNSWSKDLTLSSGHMALKPKFCLRSGTLDSDKHHLANKPELALPDPNSTGCVKIRRTKLKSVKRTNSDGSDIRLMPTRILPPRRRYSRWAISKSKQDYDDKTGTKSIQHPNPTSTEEPMDCSHEVDSLKIKREPSPTRIPKFPLSPFLSTLEGNNLGGNEDDDGDDDDDCDYDEDADYVWPPIVRDTNNHHHQINPTMKDRSKFSNSFGKSDFSQNNYYYQQTHGESNPSNSKTLHHENSSLSPNSLISSSTDQFKPGLGNRLHSNRFSSIATIPNPTFPDSSSHEQSTPNQKSQSNQIKSLCFESANFLSQSDRVSEFKWDNVFMPDDHQNRLDQLFEPDRSCTDALDLFAQMRNDDDEEEEDEYDDRKVNRNETDTIHPVKPDKLLDFVTDQESSSISHPNSSGTSKLSSTDLDQSIANLQSTMPSSSNSFGTNLSSSASPLLDDLDLEASDLNFDSFDGLVESTGPIPLDIDFTLTASFTGSYGSTSTSDLILDSNDLNATIWASNSGSLDKAIAPNAYLAKSNDPGPDLMSLSSRSQPTDQMWFNDSQSLGSSSSHSLAMLLNEASVHLFEDITSDLSTTLHENTDPNRLTTPPLN